jgi:hypothetical protein
MSPVKAAAVFVVRSPHVESRVDLHGFADRVFGHAVSKGVSVIRGVDRFVARVGEVGPGTRIAESIKATLRGHDPGLRHLRHADLRARSAPTT